MCSWITNCPAAADAFKQADTKYDRARAAAISLPLAEKIVALRQAKTARQAAYETAFKAA